MPGILSGIESVGISVKTINVNVIKNFIHLIMALSTSDDINPESYTYSARSNHLVQCFYYTEFPLTYWGLFRLR